MQRQPFRAIAPLAETDPVSLVFRLTLHGLVQSLRAGIAATDSATLFLEDWCRREQAEAKVTARIMPDHRPPSAQQRERLEIGVDEPVAYRRVQLVCGGHVLSEADNWYVPGRLTPEINRVLEETTTPFGRAVRPLEPWRRTLASTPLWPVLPEGWERIVLQRLTGWAAAAPVPVYDPAIALFENSAVVLRRDGRPMSEVRETYLMALIAPFFGDHARDHHGDASLEVVAVA